MNSAATFWARAIPEPTSGCLLWLGKRDRDGYGKVRWNGKEVRAARLALRLSGIALSEREQACHHCDTPPCIEPRHLFAGSLQQNLSDMVRKFRHNHGETHPTAKLNRAEVEALRGFSLRGVAGTMLAAVFGVSRSQVSRIVNGKERRHG